MIQLVTLAKQRAWQILAMCLPFHVQFIASYFHSVLIPCGFFKTQVSLWDLGLCSSFIVLRKKQVPLNSGKQTCHKRALWTKQWVHSNGGSLQWECCVSALFYVACFLHCQQHSSAQLAKRRYIKKWEGCELKSNAYSKGLKKGVNEGLCIYM